MHLITPFFKKGWVVQSENIRMIDSLSPPQATWEEHTLILPQSLMAAASQIQEFQGKKQPITFHEAQDGALLQPTQWLPKLQEEAIK